MEPRAQYVLCKLLSYFIDDYTREMALHLASNELARRYLQSISIVRRYLVMTHHKEGMNAVIAERMFDKDSGKFIIQKGYSYIYPERDPKLKELVENAQKFLAAGKNTTMDLYNIYPSLIYDVKHMQKALVKGNALSKDIEEKINLMLEQEEHINQLKEHAAGLCRPDNKNNILKSDGKYDQAYYMFWHILKAYIQYWYSRSIKENFEYEFRDILDTAIYDGRHCKGSDRAPEDSINEFYTMLELPFRTQRYVRFKYADSEPPKVEPPKDTNKPKTTTKKNLKPITSKKPEVKAEPIVKETKEVKEDEARNILDISKKTKLAKGYRIDKVENVAKKIIVDDKVVEISANAFHECYKLEEITLSKNLKVLNYGLFSNLHNLIKINFVEGLEEIKTNAFDQCGICGEIKLPKSLKIIESKAFNVRVPNLLKVSMSSNTKYNENSFHSSIEINGVKKKKEVKPKESVEKAETIIEEPVNIEEKYSHMEFTKPDHIEFVDKPFVIETNEYSDYSDDEWNIECNWDENDRVIAERVNEGHEVLYIPEKFEVIGFISDSYYFDEYDKVKKIILNDNVEEILPNAFLYFSNLEELILPKKPKFKKLPKNMLGLNNKKIKHIEIPNGITEIDPDCFGNCYSLEYITVGKDVDLSNVEFSCNVKVYVKK